MTDQTATPTGWRPEPNDQVVGVVTDISTGEGDWGPYPIVTIGTDDGSEIAVHAFHTVLRRELARRKPKIGTKLDITYLGKRDGKGMSYELYRVRGEGETAGYDWSRDDPDAGNEPPPASDITPDIPPSGSNGGGSSAPVAQEAAPADDDDLPF